MNTQENQTGSPMPADDARIQSTGPSTGSTGLGNDALASGTRKAAASGQARSTAQAPTASASTGSQDSQPSASQSGAAKPEDKQDNQQEGTLLDTALQSGKKWIEDSGVLDSVNDLPKSVKEWSDRAVSRLGDLTTTQKIVGGALLAVGIGYLATRKGKSSGRDSSGSDYGRKDSGSYGRRNYGYQAPDASNSRRPVAGSGRADSGAAYGNSGSRYGNASDKGSNASVNPASDRSESGAGFGSTDSGSRATGSSHSKNDDFRSIE